MYMTEKIIAAQGMNSNGWFRDRPLIPNRVCGESIMSSRIGSVFMLAACLLAACGGSQVIEDPEPLVITEPLVSASDQRLSANLDWIIYRDGPGSWAEKVDWDEYLIRVYNSSDGPVRIVDVAVIDSTGTRIERGGNRHQLIEGTRQTTSRYKDHGLEVNAGPGSWVVAGASAAAVTGVALGVYAAGFFGAATGGAIAVAAASIVLLPVATIDFVGQSMNNEKIDHQIKSRQTLFPSALQPNQNVHLNLFFPLAPSPRQIELTYVDSDGVHTLTVDTRSTLHGLHIAQAER